MNDSPVPRGKRGTIIILALLILFTFTALSMGEYGDDDYLHSPEVLSLCAKKTPLASLSFSLRKARLNSIFKFSSTDKIMQYYFERIYFDVNSIDIHINISKPNNVFILRC